MSELKNATARGTHGASTLGERMKAEYVKTQQARGDGNSQQKSVTAFAEEEVAEKARTSAAAAGQTMKHVGRTAVQQTPQSVDELKRQAQIAKAKRNRARKIASARTTFQSNSSPSSTAVSRYHSPSAQVGAPDKYARNAGFSSARELPRTASHAAKKSYIRQKQAQHAVRNSRQSVRAAIEAVKATAKTTKALVTLLIAGGWVSVIIILIVVLFGCAISMFGGGSNSKSYTPVSVEVRDYRPIIQQYAKEHGIPEYIDLIMAVMMQESGGQGFDPMQASESSYNTRFPHHPNSITDPEYSINVGIRNLAACLKAANVQSPIDMDNIKLALQGYNYGNGYIAWAQEHYKGYSTTNAIEFSDMMARKKGWGSYGDSNYVLHVLQYYPIGRAFTAGGNQVIVEIAAAQVGNKGGQPYWSWYGFKSRVAWCACYVSWCADQCGYIDAGIIPKFSLCSDGIAWFKKNGQWQDRNYLPQAGDLIFFDWGGDGHCDHVGIVEKCEDGVVYTIEGNSGNACKRQHYAVGSKKIFGYGCPMYG